MCIRDRYRVLGRHLGVPKGLITQEGPGEGRVPSPVQKPLHTSNPDSPVGKAEAGERGRKQWHLPQCNINSISHTCWRSGAAEFGNCHIFNYESSIVVPL